MRFLSVFCVAFCIVLPIDLKINMIAKWFNSSKSKSKFTRMQNKFCQTEYMLNVQPEVLTIRKTNLKRQGLKLLQVVKMPILAVKCSELMLDKQPKVTKTSRRKKGLQLQLNCSLLSQKWRNSVAYQTRFCSSTRSKVSDRCQIKSSKL